jgi:hypothetical protein
MLSSDASLGMWATGGGRTQVPGFLVHLVRLKITLVRVAHEGTCGRTLSANVSSF